MWFYNFGHHLCFVNRVISLGSGRALACFSAAVRFSFLLIPDQLFSCQLAAQYSDTLLSLKVSTRNLLMLMLVLFVSELCGSHGKIGDSQPFWFMNSLGFVVLAEFVISFSCSTRYLKLMTS